uniref:ATP synthase complex subunit 8 n=1 Tax=Teratoscincus roborowskii TaxID=102174 RepID=A0A7L9R848_9SAUR|nr:ATP synthase F0 subunit 8 [Teratoscincus roborowskii]QOL12732.1 ATP synthase F0 subunit 8 [Teratoscincus roborowskii]
MPQLNPSPWLLTMLATWAILLLIIMPKLLKSVTMNNPTPPHTKPYNMTWSWPWY